MATLEQLETALVNADRAGDMDAARKIAAVLKKARGDLSNQIPGAPVSGTVPTQAEPTLGEQAIGAGEAALSIGSGMTGGAIGMAGGAAKGMAEQILSGQFGTPEAARLVEQSAMKGAQALTYAPRTPAGPEMAQGVGETLSQVIPAIPLAGELGAVAQAGKAAVPVVESVARRASAPVVAGAKKAAQLAMPEPAKPTPGTMGSGGAAGVDIATLRQAKAEELPIPIPLTQGQKTRQFEQQRFERETAKDPSLGEPIRQRFADQNQKLQQNMDAFIDMTGAEAPDLRSIGITVDQAIRSRAAKDKAKIRTLYKEAEKAGEMESPVALDSVVAHLVESAPEAEVANVLKAAKQKAIQLGVAVEDAQGGLIAQPVTLKTAELFRRSINGATNAEPTNIRQATIMKGLIDDATAGAGGQAYKQARAARARYANDYENISLVKNIIGTKRGTADRAVAVEDVLKRSIIEPSTSLDTVRQMRRLLQTEGENGQQAWRELQGGTLKFLKDEATKNVARDERGNPIVSAAQLDRAISSLDKSGKLDFVFGKKGAEQLRTINDVAKDVLTAPPGSVNTSNTASVVLAAMDMAISGTAGVPAPILSSIRLIGKGVKDAKTRARVRQALGTTGEK